MNCFFTFQLQMIPTVNWRVENRTKHTRARIACCTSKGCLTSPSGVSPCRPALKGLSLTVYDLPFEAEAGADFPCAHVSVSRHMVDRMTSTFLFL